jgi:hypothetical protein
MITPDNLKNITDYTDKEKLQILHDICLLIYIARNISLRHDIILDQLSKIDILFRDNSENFN